MKDNGTVNAALAQDRIPERSLLNRILLKKSRPDFVGTTSSDG